MAEPKGRYGRLVVDCRVENNKYGQPVYRCVCDCKNIVTVLGYSLVSDNTNSCGCLQRSKVTTHGKSYTPEYRVWRTMIQRCSNKRSDSYENYGGRGINVCQEWIDSFEVFFKDMGARPSPKHELDRKDNEKGYNAENCRWATAKANARNRRNNRMLTMQNETLCLSAWAERLEISVSALDIRLKRWTLEEALTTPKNGKRIKISTEASS